MTISIADLIAMRERVQGDLKKREAEIKDLEDTLAALATLEKALRQEQPVQAALDLSGAAHAHAPDSTFEPYNGATSFADAVRTTVRRFAGDSFTIANVENVLKAQSVRLPENNARVRIAMEVKRMMEKKQVTVVERGRGTQPFKYRFVGEKDKGDSVGAESPSHTKLTKSRAGAPSPAA